MRSGQRGQRSLYHHHRPSPSSICVPHHPSCDLKMSDDARRPQAERPFFPVVRTNVLNSFVDRLVYSILEGWTVAVAIVNENRTLFSTIMDRSKRVEIAEETNEILRQKSYAVKNPSTGENTLVDLSEVLDAACQGTRLHRADESLNIPIIESTQETKIYMTTETTIHCLHRLHKEGCKDVLVLNFASAKNPGGGLNRESWEQEELISAASGLVACLCTPQAKPFYEFHKEMTKPGKSTTKKSGVLMYSSNMIYSPYVPVFRDREMELSCQPFTCNIISSCCVNYNTGMLNKSISKEDEEQAILLMQTRVLRVLQVAAHHGANTLLLGPWGCGINKHYPREVAKAFRGALLHPDVDGRFKQVVFAVPYEESTNVYKYFAKSFEVEVVL